MVILMENIKIYAFADEASGESSGQIKAMQRNNLDGIELRGTEFGNVSDLSFVAACLLRKKFGEAGLKVWSLGSPIGKIGVWDDFSTHLEKFRNTLELSKLMGAENIRLFSFYIPKDKSYAECRGEVMDRLGRMVEMASAYNVTLCHENEKGIYGDDAEHCLDILKTFPAIKGIFDPANFVQCNQDTLAAWEMLKPYIKYMHIKDALPDGRVVPAGCGAGNLKAIVKDFIAAGGRDFTIEPHLTVFKGLSELERAGDESKVGEVYTYPDSDTAFDAACNAFKKLVGEI